MDTLSLDIVQYISVTLSFNDQINLRQVKKEYYENIHIYDFYNIEPRLLCRLNDSILKQHCSIRFLNLENNSLVTNINYLEKLVVLNISGKNCSMTNEGIMNLHSLKQINAYNNNKITTLNNNHNLSFVDVSGTCGVDNNGLTDLTKVTQLNVSHNLKITKINHMNLKILKANGKCGINDESLYGLNLIELYIFNNNNVSCSHLMDLDNVLLEKLDASYNDKIDDYVLEKCYKLNSLNIMMNTRVRNLNHLLNLKQLNIANCEISDAGIKNLFDLETLVVSNNSNIVNVDHFEFLVNLSVWGNCGVTEVNLNKLKNLKKINIYNNIRFNENCLKKRDNIDVKNDINKINEIVIVAKETHDFEKEIMMKYFIMSIHNKIMYYEKLKKLRIKK